MSQFWAIYKKVDFPNCPAHFCSFLPFLGANVHFSIKVTNHLKTSYGILSMVFYLHAKKYKKRLNGSKDIVIWKIERSDWSRAFAPKSREREFSQIWDLCRKLANHKTLHFRSFLAKTNDSILHESPKKNYLQIHNNTHTSTYPYISG